MSKRIIYTYVVPTTLCDISWLDIIICTHALVKILKFHIKIQDKITEKKKKNERTNLGLLEVLWSRKKTP